MAVKPVPPQRRHLHKLSSRTKMASLRRLLLKLMPHTYQLYRLFSPPPSVILFLRRMSQGPLPALRASYHLLLHPLVSLLGLLPSRKRIRNSTTPFGKSLCHGRPKVGGN